MGRKDSSSKKFQEAIFAQNMATQNALNQIEQSKKYIPNKFASQSIFGDTSSSYNPDNKTISSSYNLNPKLEALYNQQLDSALNLDSRAEKESRLLAENSNRQTQKQVADLFYRTGKISNNSGVQNLIAKTSDEMASNKAQRELELKNNIKNSLLNQQSTLYNQALSPIMQLEANSSNLRNSAQNSANNFLGTFNQQASAFMENGQQVSNILQQQAQEEAQKRRTKSNNFMNLAQIPLRSFTGGL